jgi:RNA polymerase sigma-70 factor (ECF subfamily)
MRTNEHDHTEDELLAIRCQMGEPAAFDDLIDRWHGPLWTYVRRLVSQDDTAKEIVQDLWIRVIRGMPRLRDPAKLRPWLFGIARRTLMDRLREQYARPAETEVDINEVPAVGGWNDERRENLEDLEQALAALPMVEREVLTLFYLDELSLSDVSDALGVPVGTIKSRLFRARKMLRLDMDTRSART